MQEVRSISFRWKTTYPPNPMLWAHKADREQTLDVLPDPPGEVCDGQEANANRFWQTASRLHYSRDFRLHSHNLAACVAPKPYFDGRVWRNLQLRKAEHAWSLLLWANSTLGLLIFLGAKKPATARTCNCHSLNCLPDLPTLDARELKPDQLRACNACYEAHRIRALPEDVFDVGSTVAAPWLRRLEELLGLPADSRGYALVIVAQQVNWFFAGDPEWTARHVLTVVREQPGTEAVQEAFWAGFFSAPQFPALALFEKLKPHLFALTMPAFKSTVGMARAMFVGIRRRLWGRHT